MITIKNLSKSYGKTEILKNISFDIEKNDKLLIIGPSGSGKTTLIRCLNKLEKDYQGEIIFKKKNIKDIKDELLRKKIGMVFQSYNLFPHLTVKENIELAPSKLTNANKEELSKKTLKLLKSVNIEEKINEYPKNLSGGQKQRVAISRTLANNPEVILFDEPTSALDPESIKSLVKLLNELSKKATIIVVSHDMSLIKSFASKILFIDKGKIIEYGTKEEILKSTNPKIKKFLK
ncbi:MAG: amino acid ABC transporter ATP-binding protein [Bacilli bacterium]|nr:amino acid ABC transporter ATP-binding protein [Bacilli bacterium]